MKEIRIEKVKTKKGFINIERIEGGIDKYFVYGYLNSKPQLSFFIDDLFGVVLTEEGRIEFYKNSYADGAFIGCKAPEIIKDKDIEESMKKTLVSLYNESSLVKDPVVDERYVTRKKLFGFIHI